MTALKKQFSVTSSKHCRRVNFIACLGELMQEGDLTSIARFNPYSGFAGHAQKLTSQISSRTNYLMPSYNIVVLVCHLVL